MSEDKPLPEYMICPCAVCGEIKACKSAGFFKTYHQCRDCEEGLQRPGPSYSDIFSAFPDGMFGAQ